MESMFKIIFNWSKRFRLWISEAKTMILCVLVILAAVLLGFVSWSSEVSIRSSGYGLQIIGMIFAARGLLRIRIHFGQPPLRKNCIDWLKRFPKFKQDVVIGTINTTLPAMSADVRIEQWFPDKPEDPLEKRFEALLKNVDNIIRNGQTTQAKSIDKLRYEHDKRIKNAEENSKVVEANIRSDLESLHTDDIFISLIGLIWLVVGISFSTMAPELHSKRR